MHLIGPQECSSLPKSRGILIEIMFPTLTTLQFCHTASAAQLWLFHPTLSTKTPTPLPTHTPLYLASRSLMHHTVISCTGHLSSSTLPLLLPGSSSQIILGMSLADPLQPALRFPTSRHSHLSSLSPQPLL